MSALVADGAEQGRIPCRMTRDATGRGTENRAFGWPTAVRTSS
jgi:hypothetical protein